MQVNRPLRVLQIISGFAVEGPLGGLERFGIELSRHLDPTTFDNTLVGLWSYGQPTEAGWMEKASANGTHTWMGPAYDFARPYRSFLQCYRAFIAHFEGQQFDIIHSHCQFGDVLALLAARKLGAKVKLRTVHNEREWGKRLMRRLLLTNLLYPITFQAEAGVSQRVVDNLDERVLARIVKRQAYRIYNAVDLVRFTKPGNTHSLREEYGLPPDSFLAGSIGRLTQQKAFHDLISAAEIIVKENPKIYFMIVGDGELRADLEQQIRKSGLTNHVILTGILTHIEDVIRNWDLFVSSSHWEGLPTVLLESMAAGVPVVATRVSGTCELIEHRENGFLVPPSDVGELAAAILYMANNPGFCTALSEQALQTVKRFSIDTIVNQYEELYLSLI